MGRRSAIGGLVSAIARAQRVSVATQKRAAREHVRTAREHARAVRQYERAQAAYNREMEREAKRQYLQDQLEAAEDRTAALAARSMRSTPYCRIPSASTTALTSTRSGCQRRIRHSSHRLTSFTAHPSRSAMDTSLQSAHRASSHG